jgi:hypothetical protein
MRVSVYHNNYQFIRNVNASPARVQRFIAKLQKRYAAALQVLVVNNPTCNATYLYLHTPTHYTQSASELSWCNYFPYASVRAAHCVAIIYN